MAYTRDVVSEDLQIEKDILVGMIISTQYLQDVADMIDPKLFKVDYIKRVSQWALSYYRKYRKAPFKDLQSIYAAESVKLKPAESEIIGIFLSELSDRYQEGDPFNKDYWVDKTIVFCKDRALETLEQKIQGYRLQGDVEKAEEAVRGFYKVSKSTSKWINPFDPKEIDKTFEQDDANKLFMLPGIIGEMMGWLERGWLVSFMAPTKRGKSFMAWETVYQGLVCRLKVAIFSLEMNETTNKKRIYKRLTAMAEDGGEYAYPVFDCCHNQEGTCTMEQRANKIVLVENGTIPPYRKEMKYRPCDYCRKDNACRDKYKAATWWQTQVQTESLTPDIIKKKVAGFKKMFGNNLRLIAPPSFSVGFDFIESKLDELEYVEGFVPDIILTDSLDITEQEVANELQDENIKWMKAKRLAGTRYALVINCNQGNRGAEEAITQKKKHTGGTIKKIQNVDVEYTLNQTDEEKEQGVMRVEVLVHRHDESTEKGQVYVLQQLKLGQPNLDSEWIDNKRRR